MLLNSKFQIGIKCSFLNDGGELETWEYQGNNFTNTAYWALIGNKKNRLQEKFLSVPTDNININLDSSGLYIKIEAPIFLFIRKNIYKSLSSCSVNPCELSIYGDKVICFSDSENSYVPCSYGSTIYMVATARNNAIENDVVLGLNNMGVYSNYPIIISALYKNITEEKINNLSLSITSIDKDLLALSSEITSLNVYDWDWEKESGAVVASGYCIIPNPIPISGYISFKILNNSARESHISLFTKSGSSYVKNKDIYTYNPLQSMSISEHSIPEKLDITDTEYYIGIDNASFVSGVSEGEFVLLVNGSTYKGLCFSYSISGELKQIVNNVQQSMDSLTGEMEELSNKIEELNPDFRELEDHEYWIKVQGNTFDSSELYTANGASVSDNSASLNDATSYVALKKIYWSNRRIHRFIVTPTTLGILVINLAQNTSNVMFPTFTDGNWASAFKIDFSNKKIYMGDNIEFDMSSMNFVAGRKYIIELKYIKRVFYVTITDFLNYDSYTAMLDARDSNKNGGFKNTLIIQNQSGNYTVEQIETYEVANPTLVLFGDSVTEAIGRVGEGQNYSEIISEKIKSCTIIAQGGAGAGSWNNIFENEIKYIKPKYCSFHMGLNGGFNNTQLEKFITDCESIGAIPILNHVICTTQMSIGNTQETYNSVLDGVVEEKGYMGYYGDIATATNNDIASQSNYFANNAADGKFNIKKTAMSKDCFNTYTIAAGKTVIENEEERVLDSPLEVIVNIHPKAAGHEVMADRYLKEVNIV